MTNKIIIFITTSLFLFACADSQLTDTEKNKFSDTSTSLTKGANPVNNEDGPPISDTCLCSFDYIGIIRTGVKRFDLIISGKGWNLNFYSCSWTWGELINNEFPPDSNVTDFRIHLVALNKLENNLDSTFLTSKLFNDNLIVTYSRTGNDEHMTCKFDPNKTNKFPKPKQWTEE